MEISKQRTDRSADAAGGCADEHEHGGRAGKIAGALPDEASLAGIATLFKMMSDPTRLTILYALVEAESCVCDLVELTEVSQPTVSHHLRLLKAANLIKSRREGRLVYYALEDEHVRTMLRDGREHAEEER